MKEQSAYKIEKVNPNMPNTRVFHDLAVELQVAQTENCRSRPPTPCIMRTSRYLEPKDANPK
jgi:hypothetical protein